MTANCPASPPGKNHLPAFDGLRGLAILLVLLWHCFACVDRAPGLQEVPILGKIAGYGWMGVYLFFCLSGFFITRILTETRNQAGCYQQFLIRRACRILPLYAVLLITYGAALTLFPTHKHPALGPLLYNQDPFWPYLFFLQNFTMLQHNSIGGHWLGVTWSLALEVQFYVLALLLFVNVTQRAMIRVLLLLALLGLTTRHLVFGFNLFPHIAGFLLLPARIDAFVIGALAAYATQTIKPTRTRQLGVVVVILGLSVLFELGKVNRLPFLQPYFGSLAFLFISINFGALLWLVYGMQHGLANKVLSWRPLVWFGTTSYFIYLFHQPANHLVHFLLGDGAPHLRDSRGWTLTLLAMGLVLGLAQLSHRYFESVFIRLGQGFEPFKKRTVGEKPAPVPRRLTKPWKMPASRYAVLGVVTLHVWLAASVSRTLGTTSDEIAHLTSGYLYWTKGDYRFQPENGYFPQRWAALPLLGRKDIKFEFPSDKEAWLNADIWQVGDTFFHRNGNDLDSLLASGRAMNAVLSGLLCLAIFLISRRIFGERGAWIALLFAALSPTLLAHGGLITSDTAGTLGFLLAAWTWWRLLDRLTPARILAAAAAASFLALSKFSVVLFAPVAAVLLIARLARPAALRWTAGKYGGRITGWLRLPVLLGASGLASGLVGLAIWSAYGFRYSAAPLDAPPNARFAQTWDEVLFLVPPNGPLTMADGQIHEDRPDPLSGPVQVVVGWSRDHRLLPEAWLYGLAFVEKNSRGRLAYFAGEYRMTGWPEFFPTAFLVKSTPPELLLFALAVPTWFLARRRSVWLYRALPWFTILAIYGIFAIRSHLNIGHRHLLPIYAAAFILAGAITARPDLRRVWLVVVAAILAWQAKESFSARPDYLPYFNASVGGAEEAHRLFVDSSLDWGQDLPRLRAWIDANSGDQRVYLSYFGSGSPSHAGIRAVRFGDGYFDWEPRRTPPHLQGGIYCLSATMLRRVYTHVRGPWSAAYEEAYQKLEAWLVHVNSRPAGTDPTEIDGTPLARETITARLFTYEQLQFGRLCHYLETRVVDARAGKSILIYKLSDAEIALALKAPLPRPTAAPQ